MILHRFTSFIASVALLGSLFCLTMPEASANPKELTLTFAGTEYFHRWSKGTQHEFTPKGQDDLKHWNDMVTINYYPKVKDGEGLAEVANKVLELYKSYKAEVVKTDSVPRTDEKPAEHLIVALIPTSDFVEAIFTRLKMVDGIGSSVVYSHRVYGKEAGDEMSAWFQKNGPAMEKALMKLNSFPSPKQLKN